jgi:serine phosphatase RsbU (regulator of sigma subunit)
MDRIFYFGDDSQQVPKFLERLGYSILGVSTEVSVPDLLFGKNVDLILIDGRITPDVSELCRFFRAQEDTRLVPIVCIAPEHTNFIETFDSLERVEVVQSPLSVGTLASRIATQLRLRKAAGDDAKKGSLAEINAALRDHNMRFQKDLEEARSIQQGLLPRELPSDPRFQVAVSYQPLEQVGGDWYFIDFSNRQKLSLHVSDVSGHGLPAAFIGSMAKLAMVAAEKERPDQLLNYMNHYLAPQLSMGRFITMGNCLYDAESGHVQWARAGHNPALLCRRATQEIVQLKGDGFPLGFLGDTTYELVEETLLPGDVLLIYTDGITEAQNRAMVQFGMVRLAEALKAVVVEPKAGDMVRGIIDRFSQFLEGRLLKDDVTLMLLKREL